MMCTNIYYSEKQMKYMVHIEIWAIVELLF